MKYFKKGDRVKPLPNRHSSNDYMFRASKAKGGGIKELEVLEVNPGGQWDLKCKIIKGSCVRKWYGDKSQPGNNIYICSSAVEIAENPLYAIY